MSNEQHDELIEAYRRASASDADRPNAATRAAILAEAAANARRNAPAANESRYWMRAVAGIAVLGISVVLWRQTHDRLPDDVPMVIHTPEITDIVTEAERTPLPQNTPKPERAAGGGAAKADRAVANAARELPSLEPFPATPSVDRPPVAATGEAPPSTAKPPSPPLLARNVPEDDELMEIQVTGTRIQVPKSESAAAAPAAGAGAGAPRDVDTTALLRQYFPAQYQSDASHSVWLVLNAGGEVLQSGELAPGQRLTDLAPQLARTLGNRVPGPWQVQTLRNARGQPIELAVARLP